MRQTSQTKPCPRKLYAIRPILEIMTPKRIERFELKIDRVSPHPKGCHLWLGGTNGAGYGLVQGCDDYQAFSLLTHRIAWALRHQLEPGIDDVIRHSCDNPPCCNGRHLLIGDHRDNTQDMIDRGRQIVRNGRHGPQRRNVDKPTEARRLRYEDRQPIAAIAAALGTHRATVMRWLALP